MYFLKNVFLAVVALIVVEACGLASPAEAADYSRCPDSRVSVFSPSGANATLICEKADKARAFLAACGIEATHQISVHVTDDVASSAEPGKGGDFDPVARRVRLLPFSGYLQLLAPAALTPPAMAREMHASIAAHEIAHGIFHERAAKLDLPDTAHEYVAYVVQFSTLPAELQQRLMNEADLPRVANLFMFSFFLLRADPERFALNAYRHFHQPENGCGFLQRVLDGNVHFPPPSD